MAKGSKSLLKHYLYLLLWGASLFVACSHEFESLKFTVASITLNFNFLTGPLFLFVFFLLTTYKVLGNMLTVFVVVGIVSCLFPPIAAIISVLSIVFVLLKIKFLIQNWRALSVGLYAYFGYLAIVVVCGKLLTFPGSERAMFVIALVATGIFSTMVNGLYQRGYGTDKVFGIIGLTPLTILSILLPFLKVDIDGQEIFHGSLSDHASLNIHEHVVSIDDLPDDVSEAMKAAGITTKDLIKLTGFNIGDIIDVPTFSHALEASVAASAAFGIFQASNHEERTVRNDDGTVEIISPVDETHAVIKNQAGEEIGAIFFDKQNGRETVILKGGYVYSIEQATGNVLDGEGKILGKVTEGAQGSRLLLDAKNRLVRKFQADGTILDSRNNEVGVAAV